MQSNVSKQAEETWSQLHRRLTKQECNYVQALGPYLKEKMQQKASACATNIGFFTTCLLSTITHLLSYQNIKFNVCDDYEVGMNLYSIFIGPPSTGKSSAVFNAVTGK